jgi:integrase
MCAALANKCGISKPWPPGDGASRARLRAAHRRYHRLVAICPVCAGCSMARAARPALHAIAAASGAAARRVRIAGPAVRRFPGGEQVSPTTTRQLNRVCHVAAERAGLRSWVAPHTLRRSGATHLLEQDIEVRMNQVL